MHGSTMLAIPTELDQIGSGQWWQIVLKSVAYSGELGIIVMRLMPGLHMKGSQICAQI
jgi:hypothetical protein